MLVTYKRGVAQKGTWHRRGRGTEGDVAQKGAWHRGGRGTEGEVAQRALVTEGACHRGRLSQRALVTEAVCHRGRLSHRGRLAQRALGTEGAWHRGRLTQKERGIRLHNLKKTCKSKVTVNRKEVLLLEDFTQKCMNKLHNCYGMDIR